MAALNSLRWSALAVVRNGRYEAQSFLCSGQSARWQRLEQYVAAPQPVQRRGAVCMFVQRALQSGLVRMVFVVSYWALESGHVRLAVKRFICW